MIHKKGSLAAVVAAMSIAFLTPSIVSGQRTPTRTMGPTPTASAVPVAARRVISTGVRVNTTRSVGSARPRTSVATATTTTTTTTMPSTGNHSEDTFGFGGGFPLSLKDLLNITPSNGFNWQDVNSLNQDLPIKAFIDPVTQIEVAQAEKLLRLTGGAFPGGFILSSGGYYMPAEQEGTPAEQATAEAQPAQPPQPQIIVLQQAPAQQAAAPSKAEAAPQEEIPDRGPFTLVLRSGKQVQAVAFTHSQGKIVYITPEGGRFTIAATDLDPDATMRVNEARGTPLQLHI